MKSKFQRIIALICCAAIIGSLSIFSVSADTDIEPLETSWFDVLEYFGYSSGISNYKHVTNTATYVNFSYSPPQYVAYGLDIIVKVDGTFDRLEFSRSGITYSFTGESIGGGLYRVFGNFDEGETGSFNFRFFISNCTFVEVVKFDLLISDFIYDNPVSTIDVGTSGGGFYDTQEFGHQAINFEFEDHKDYYDLEFINPASWTAEINTEKWYLYDYIEYHFTTNVDFIDYLYVKQGDIELPITVSYFDVTDNTYIDDGTSLYFAHTYRIIVKIDLTDCIRSKDYADRPTLYLGGRFYYLSSLNNLSPASGSGRSFTFSYANGYVETSTMNSFYYRLHSTLNTIGVILNQIWTEITKWGQNIVDKLEELFGYTEEQQEVIDQADQAISDGMAAEDEIPTPDFGDLDYDHMNGLIDQDGQNPFGDFFLIIVYNPYIYPIFLFTMFISIIALVLWGRR